MKRKNDTEMRLSRRTVLVTGLAAAGSRALPPIVARTKAKRILTVVVDKATGAMRAIDRVVP
ncbi:MAG: Tat pathway signal protein [Pseudomonadota bacterium]